MPTAAVLPPPPSIPADPASIAALRLWDCAQEWMEFSRIVPGTSGCWESSLGIDGMHCASCALRVETLLKAVPGVLKAEVSAASHRARIIWREAVVLPSTWLGALQRAGYSARLMGQSDATKHTQSQSQLALWRWLVAGLCMMQVMMYAAPAYLAEPGDITPDLQQLLRWASWVLSLPVVLFSCLPFFRQAWQGLRQGQISMELPVSLGILITFLVSTAGTFDAKGLFGQEVYFDSLTMFVFFLLTGRWLESRLRDRTAGALDALLQRLPDSVERCNDHGQFERVRICRLRKGDLIRVCAGEAFPADGELVQGKTLVDEALLTGESEPLAKEPGAAVIAGSYNLSSSVQVRVLSLGAETRFSEIVTLMERAAQDKPHWAQLADRIAGPFLAFVLLAAGTAGIYWWGQSPQQALMVAVAVLVVTCPCALSLATPTAMLSAAGSLASQGILVRRLQAFETLAAVDLMVFDKTGTLTLDSCTVSDVRCSPGMNRTLALGLAAALAQNSRHPVSRALVQAASPIPWAANDVSETMGLGLSGRVFAKGDEAEKVSIAGELRLGTAQFCGLVETQNPCLQVHLADAQGWLASFDLQEQLRPDTLATLQAFKAEGIELHVLSGDSQPALERLAGQLVLSPKKMVLKAGCSPADKLLHLRSAQQQGYTVAMVGDGFNDGPVMAGANVSFAIGNAAPLTQKRADFILPSGKLSAVLEAWRLAKRTVQVVRQNLLWAAAYNLLCIPMAVLGWLPAWAAGLGMATSSLLVLLNALRLSTALLERS